MRKIEVKRESVGGGMCVCACVYVLVCVKKGREPGCVCM